MLKTTKILLIFVLIFSIYFNFAYATSTEENSETDQTTSDIDTSDFSNETNKNTETVDENNTTYTSNYSGVTSVNTLSNYSEANLGLNNILSIILIAVGVLIILLAIAILIRLGH